MAQQMDPRRRDALMHRALLLVERHRFVDARRLLALLPRDDDVDDLLARIAEQQGRGKNTMAHLRELRYQFHLDTSARRAWAYVLALGSLVYGGHEVWKATAYASAYGLAVEITTQVEDHSHRWVDYTRPIWYDLAYGTCFTVAGLFVIWFVHRVARGAADWEELTASDSDWRGARGVGWW